MTENLNSARFSGRKIFIGRYETKLPRSSGFIKVVGEVFYRNNERRVSWWIGAQRALGVDLPPPKQLTGSVQWEGEPKRKEIRAHLAAKVEALKKEILAGTWP